MSKTREITEKLKARVTPVQFIKHGWKQGSQTPFETRILCFV
jgi:hypothetical protein